MSRVTLRNVSRHYGASIALHPTTLDVGEGEFLTLLGPSGCGKTTTLRMVAGFVTPTTGRVLIGGDDVTDLPPNKRQIGMVFQEYALFPHLTIADNIGFGLRERGVARRAVGRRVSELLDLVQLPQIAGRYPSEISGGQQQRVALARAIAHPPRLLLMDEPLGALDLKMREAMQLELRRIQRSLGITTIYVTHDQNEAMNLSDSIAVMAHGRVVQRGTAQEIYDHPATRFVADFVGQINLLQGPLAGHDGEWDVMRVQDARLRMPRGPAATAEVTLGIRPQNLSLSTSPAQREGHNHLPARVVGHMFNGNLCQWRIAVAGMEWNVESRPGEHDLSDGAAVFVSWQPAQSVVLQD
jgi:ABC-type Fe3+/spermidine/putrescine transport system ATPase subunit